jgi:pilus assembly protein Flp/PilA
MKNLFARFVKDESGATAIEYGLIAALIGVGIIVAATNLGTQLSNTFSTIETKLKAATAKA